MTHYVSSAEEFPREKNMQKENTFILEQPKQDGHQFLREMRLEGVKETRTKTKQKTEPALLQLQFAKYVEAGIFDIFIPYSTIKCIKFR